MYTYLRIKNRQKNHNGVRLFRFLPLWYSCEPLLQSEARRLKSRTSADAAAGQGKRKEKKKAFHAFSRFVHTRAAAPGIRWVTAASSSPLPAACVETATRRSGR